MFRRHIGSCQELIWGEVDWHRGIPALMVGGDCGWRELNFCAWLLILCSVSIILSTKTTIIKDRERTPLSLSRHAMVT